MPSSFAVVASVLQVLGLEPNIATDPTVATDGTLEVATLVPGSVAEVQKALEDPVARGRLFPSVHDVRVIGRQGDCVDLRMTTDGVSDPFVYDMRSCKTPQGWKDTLLSSDDLDSMDASWSLRAVAEGVEVRYRLKVALDLPIPRSLVNGRQGRDMKSAMEHLIQRLVR